MEDNVFVDCCTPKALEAPCNPIAMSCRDCVQKNNSFTPSSSGDAERPGQRHSLKMDDLVSLSRPTVATGAAVLVQLLLVAGRAHGGTYLHSSKSIDGPWRPVIPHGCNDTTGIWQANASIPFGAGIAGGYGGGPFLVDKETADASGLAEGSVVVITTYNLSLIHI